ncbi:astacin-like metalloendopeptidase [Ascaphus truei]|uniref:astacin-like metalloendopeptidase n=1 Tax=Ascaphus truei TaxID=8439 RepID=UPI003F5A4F7E
MVDVGIYIPFLSCLLGAASGLPLQISIAVDNQKEGNGRLEQDGEDVCSIITKSNQGSKKLIHQGDIAIRLSRSALGCPGRGCFWPKSSAGTVHVPYTLSPDYTAADSAIIYSAIQEYITLTCIRFVGRNTETDYIQIRSIDGCWSYLGRIGGAQDLSLLSTGCISKGIVQHELNHVLGFIHEHTRSDRDSYVDIKWTHIPDAFVSNFEKSAPETNNLALQYDYTSVMHYGRYAFTNVPGQVTIVPKPDSTVTIGQRYGLSSLDVVKINRLYQCDVCSALLSDPSGTLSSEYKNPVPLKKSNCVWLIRVPANKVFLQFDAFGASAGCTSDYIKVYDGASRTSPLLLDRTCGKGQPPPLVASGSLMLVEFVSDGVSGFAASYRTVKCGGTLTALNRTLTSPGYSMGYPPSIDCTWTIVASPAYRVLLNMTSFALETSRNCIYDYVSLLDGSRPGPSNPQKFCGTRTVPVLISSVSWLLLQFHTDRSVQNIGFRGKFTWDVVLDVEDQHSVDPKEVPSYP